MRDASQDPERLFHVVIGEPDPENCPICRAHGLAKTEPGRDPVQIDEIPLVQVLGCTCPLCERSREEGLGD